MSISSFIEGHDLGVNFTFHLMIEEECKSSTPHYITGTPWNWTRPKCLSHHFSFATTYSTSSDGQSSHDSTSSAESTAVSESNLTVSPTSHFRGSLKLCTPNPLRRTAADSIKARRAMQEAIQLPSLLHDDDVHVADENNDKHNDDNCKKGDNKDGKENEKDCETEKNDHLPTTTRVSSKQKRAKEVQKLLALVDVQDPKLKHAMERLSRKLEQEVIHKLERDIRASNHFC